MSAEKVWFLQPTWVGKVGGTETALNTWTQALVSYGAEVSWWNLSDPKSDPKLVPDGVISRTFDPLSSKLGNLVLQPGSVRNLVDVAKKEQPDVIVANGVNLGLVPVLEMLGRADFLKRMALIFHTDPNPSFQLDDGLKGQIKYYLKEIRNKNFARLVESGAKPYAVSKYIARRLEETGIANGVEVIYPSSAFGDVDPVVRNTKERLTATIVTRISPEKGMDFLSNVVDATNNERLPVDFRLVGSAVDKKYGDEVAERLGNNVEMVGPKRGKDLSNEYAQADVVIQPSPNEAFGLVPVEAMLHAAPIAVRYEAAIEFFDNPEQQPGRLAKGSRREQVDGYVGFLSELIDTSGALRTYSVAALGVASRYHPDKLAYEFVAKILGRN